MEFTVMERMLLLDILPAQGNITTLRIVRKLKEDLSFSEEEHKVLQIFHSPEKGTVIWDIEAAKDTDKEIAVGEKALDIIKETLSTLERRGALKIEHIPLYERFVEAKDVK